MPPLVTGLLLGIGLKTHNFAFLYRLQLLGACFAYLAGDFLFRSFFCSSADGSGCLQVRSRQKQ